MLTTLDESKQMKLTYTGNSITSETIFTLTGERTICVCTGSIRVTVVCLLGTLINFYYVINKRYYNVVSITFWEICQPRTYLYISMLTKYPYIHQCLLYYIKEC